MANPILEASELYRSLKPAYDNTKDLAFRFQTCYDIVDQASYSDIHFLITALKESRFTDGMQNALDASVPDAILDAIKTLFNLLRTYVSVDAIKRNTFLLDILEEARERKRPQ